MQRPAQPYSEASGAAVQVPPSLPSSSSSAAAVPVEVAASTSSGAAAGGGRPLPKPFAIIDAVSQYSPAAEAGIQIGDQLCQFGDQLPAPDASGATLLQQVAATVQVAHEQGAAVQTVLLRHGAPVTLSLTPRRWAGQGLLGCHLRPFPL